MKAHYFHAAAVAAVILSVMTAPAAQAVDLSKANPANWFKKEEATVPSSGQKQSQESAAAAMNRDAKTAVSTGNKGRALDIYKSVVKQYPFTDAAADAQFEYSKLLRENGKFEDAYEGFQKFITDFRQSPRFAEAVQEQFQIAEESRTGKHSSIFVVIPAKVGPTKLIEMYQGVIRNAPFSKYSAPAMFAIGEIYQDKGDKALADAAFQQVVDNHPGTKIAAEAQFRIGSINNANAKRTQDSANLVKARDALEIYKASHPTGDRMGEIEALKKQNTDLSAVRALEIAEFYQKSGKPKAAAIYYNEAIKFGSAEAAVKAREQLAVVAAAHPEEVKENAENDFTVPAAMNLKNRSDYAGPPVPELAKLSQKTKMRVEKDDFKPIPLKEPELPTRPTTAPAPGMLIPPTPATGGDKPLLLPVPPVPGMAPPNALPIPPKPADDSAPKNN
ncbi:MAG: tetratricopeptide repeat protein [Verrucomicrobia bacterium]|nr:tetratricopeptide repeat protein [Verrucomicrobiota bacterium]